MTSGTLATFWSLRASPDRAGLAEARCEAWRARPTAERLFRLAQADASHKLLAREADHLTPGDDGRLARTLPILAGRLDAVASRLDAAPAPASGRTDTTNSCSSVSSTLSIIVPATPSS